MTIDLQAISITSAFNSILSFFKSQENNSKWKDLTTGAEGIFLIRMLANIITNISYRLITARRENYISTANLLSSVIGISVNLGYSAYRGSNQKRRIQLLPNSDYVIPKLSVIGNYNNDYDIINLEDLDLHNNELAEFKTVIGKIKTLSFQAETNQVKLFTQFVEGISEDFVLFVDNIEVPTSKVIKDLTNNKYLVRTNPHNSVDIIYLNNALNATYKYGTESEITLKYIELADVPTIDYESSMFMYGDLYNTLTIDNYLPFETVEEIKVNAPVNHEVQNLIRSKPDYSKRVKQLVPNVKETSYKPITPTYTLITYLKDDYTHIKKTEREALLSILNQENFFGTPLPDITQPSRETIKLDIKLQLADTYKDKADIQEDIKNILKSNYTVALNQEFNIYSLERLLEGLSYVTYARVSYRAEERESNKIYQPGDIIKHGENYFKVSKNISISGEREPLWNVPMSNTVEIDTGLETEDGGVYWRAYKKLAVDEIRPWYSNSKYKIGDYVSSELYPNYMFKCVDLKKYSGTTTPETILTSIGDFVNDGSIIWVSKLYNPSYNERKNSTPYRLGDSVNVSGKSFECIGYRGYSSGAIPPFESLEYDIDSINESSFIIKGDLTRYFATNEIFKAITSSYDYSYVVSSSTYNPLTDKTTIETRQDVNLDYDYTGVKPAYKGTIDGEIFWEIIETEKLDSILYDWNVYNIFSYTLTLK